MSKWFLMLVFCGALCSCADQGITFSAQPGFYGEPTGGGVIFFLPLNNNTVTAGEKNLVIKVPESFKNKDVAYGDVYFGGGGKSKTGNSIFILVHSINEPSPVIVFDVNGNADFTDDSIFRFTKAQPFDVVFRNYKDGKAAALNRFWFEDSADVKFKVLFDMGSARKGVKPLSFCLRDRRLNYKKVILPDSNVVTLYDWDNNGFYNNKEDKIAAGDLTLDTFSLIDHNPILTKRPVSGELLPYSNNTYKLLSVNKYGSDIRVDPLNKVVPLVEKLPEFSYTNEADKKVKFAVDTSKNFFILYFWGAWCIGCRQQTPYLVKMIDSLPSVKLYTFNYGDKKERMLSYIKQHSYPFEPNKVNDETTEELFVTGYPTFIVLNKNREVLLRTMQVGMVKYYLSNNSVK